MKFLLSVIVLSALSFVTWILIEMRPQPESKKIVRKIPIVEVITAEREPIRSSVSAYGTIRPRTLTTLIAEVPGIIEEVAPFDDKLLNKTNFRAGGFFKKGDLLLKIEDIDLQTLKADANANLRRAELQLLQEKELAKQAKIEWGNRDWSLASDLVKRIPQIKKAEAEANAAQARLLQASQDLNRSQVRAPFEGRILKTMADVGQQVGAGSSAALAQVYALDSAEIDFALSRSEMKFLGFSDGFLSEKNIQVEAHVLNSEGQIIHKGWLDRSEGIVDPRTRLTNLVVRVDKCVANPFSANKIIAPLAVGQFVNLQMLGLEVEVFLIPESAFRTHDTLLIVDENNQLISRKVSVIHRSGQKVWVESGLEIGEQVCTTPIEIISEGMEVRLINETMKADSNATKP